MRVPGIRAGLVPERPDRDVGDFLEGLLARVRGWRARRQFDRIVSTIDEAAPTSDLAHAEDRDAEIDRLCDEARAELAIHGMRGPALAKTFALLREVAHETLGLRPFDVQLFGAWVMTQGKLAEMATGEGKTLATALTAAAAGLAGLPVHVISCNDYLVERDAEAMRSLLERVGLSVGCVTGSNDDDQARREAYDCDVVYVTAHQLAFDYLRDFAAIGAESGFAKRIRRLENMTGERRLKGLVFAIVDEADSVLIDAARTPFVLSRSVAIQHQEVLLRGVLSLAAGLDGESDFESESRNFRCALSDAGRAKLEGLYETTLDEATQAVLHHPRLRAQWVERALAVLHLYERETHYVVHEGKIDIVDQPSGRRMPDHAWDHGVHQLVECKEGCAITPRVEPVARISGQRLFSRYLHLAGMTGTARAAQDELARVYHLDCVVVPTRLPVRRESHPPQVFVHAKDHWSHVLERIAELREAGKPVLVATRTVEESESLSAALTGRGLSHRVLNASQDREEADVIAQAGRAGRITVATNMAGRGTDILLGPGVEELGGLHVVSIELGESRRFDGQLRGRCARQGDPGSFEQILCLEDGGVLERLPHWIRARAAQKCLLDERNRSVIPITLGKALVWFAQQAEERRSAQARRSLVRQQREWDSVLAFAGPQE